MLLIALLACADPLPPLEDVRIELARLDREPLPVGWAPQATVVVSEALLEDLIARAALSQEPIPDIVARPLGLEVRATPRVEPPAIALSASEACPACMRVDTDWAGSIRFSLAMLATDVSWKSVVGATVAIEGEPAEAGFQLELVPFEPDNWTIGLTVMGMPSPHDEAFERILASRIEERVRTELSGPVVLATMPQDGDVRLRGVRARVAPASQRPAGGPPGSPERRGDALSPMGAGPEGPSRVDQGLAVDLGFSTIVAGEVRETPDPREGFAVVLPAKTLLGIAQAAVVRHGAYEGYLAEPTALHLDGERFELWLKVWKQARREKWREFVLRGSMKLENGQLAFVPDVVAQVDKEQWASAADPIIKKVALDALAKAAVVTMPARYVQSVGGKEIVIEVVDLEARSDMLTVWGVVK